MMGRQILLLPSEKFNKILLACLNVNVSYFPASHVLFVNSIQFDTADYSRDLLMLRPNEGFPDRKIASLP